jgi:hypothetical protein
MKSTTDHKGRLPYICERSWLTTSRLKLSAKNMSLPVVQAWENCTPNESHTKHPPFKELPNRSIHLLITTKTRPSSEYIRLDALVNALVMPASHQPAGHKANNEKWDRRQGAYSQ